MIPCRSRLLTMNKTWLYHYDPETKQESIEGRHSGSPSPIIFLVQKSAGNFSNWFFDIKRHRPYWLSSKRLNCQHGVLLISAGAIEGHFEGKTLREIHQGCLVLAWQISGSPCTYNPQEIVLPGLSMSWSTTLFSRSGPVGLPPLPWIENNWKLAIFRPTRR